MLNVLKVLDMLDMLDKKSEERVGAEMLHRLVEEQQHGDIYNRVLVVIHIAMPICFLAYRTIVVGIALVHPFIST